MRPRNERRERSARCPECGKYFSPQGLNGHLRFTHGQGVETMQKTKEKAKLEGGIAARATQTMKLASQLKQLRDQRREVKELDENLVFEDKGVAAAVAALDLSERELVNELRKLAGQEPLADDGEEEEEEEDDD